MAWSVSINHKSVWGNMRVHILSCVADAATQNVDTGLARVFGHSIDPGSLSTGGVKVYPNSGAGGTAIAGTLGCSGFVSGDVVFFTVYGK